MRRLSSSVITVRVSPPRRTSVALERRLDRKAVDIQQALRDLQTAFDEEPARSEPARR
jgi:hypothetical protein